MMLTPRRFALAEICLGLLSQQVIADNCIDNNLRCNGKRFPIDEKNFEGKYLEV